MTDETVERQLQQKIAQLAAVREISRAIAEARDLDSTLDLITRRTTEVMGVQSCSIYLYNRSGDALVLAASTGLRATGIGQVMLPKGAGLTGWAAEHRETVTATHAAADPRFFRVLGSGESKFASLMAMPLLARGTAIGAINVQTAEFHQFSADEIELFSFITDLAATALEKTKSVHAAVVQEIHHRVKNNLQTIAMLLRLQLAQDETQSPREILRESINRVLSIAAVHEILAHEHHTQVALKNLVSQVAHTVTQTMTLGERVSLTVSGEDFVVSSQAATHIALAVNELVQNSLEHGLRRTGGNIAVTIGHYENLLVLTVRDDGAGLPADFRAGESDGLGLELIRTLVEEDLGGEFRLAANGDGGTTATVRLPLAAISVDRRLTYV